MSFTWSMANFRSRTSNVFVSACCVYYVMAACGGSGGGRAGDGSSGSSGGLDPDANAPSSGSVVPNAMADEWWKPGTRLKLQYFDAEDGTKQFSSWYDSKRNEACSFVRHADGSTRCLPSTSIFVQLYFSNPGCTTPLALRLKSGAPAPKYAALIENDGARRFPATPYAGSVYVGSASSCTFVEATSVASWDLFAIGAEVPASAFVGATIKTAP